MSRPLPQPDADTAFFWDACARGELAILRCTACRRWVHYPRPRCPGCGATTLEPERVSGRGTVHSFTVTHFPVPGFEPPFAVVLVDLDDAPGVRLVSNLVGVEPADVRIGTKVEVTFEQHEDVTLPLFKVRTDA